VLRHSAIDAEGSATFGQARLVRGFEAEPEHANGRADSCAGVSTPASAGHFPPVSVVIPALNEARNLPHVLARLPAWISEVLLVDGNSADSTAEVARELFPLVKIVGQPGRGKGDALAAGFAAATGDIIVMLDADGSANPGEIARFVTALLEGADFAKGSRFAPGGGSSDITRTRRIGNRLLGGLVNILYGTRFTDLCYGYNAFWRHCLPSMRVDCQGFEVETLINIRVARAGLRVTEVPSFEERRIFGESNLRPFRDGLRVLRTILRERLARPPDQGELEVEPVPIGETR
jgi:glycosyltransferase involved in cell wall biosynthesis